MKADLFDITGKKLKQIELPSQFNEEVRPDLIKRAVLVVQSNDRQAYGAHPHAGERASADISKRRKSFKTSYGHGISRTPRKSLWRRGTQFGWVGAVAPQTRKGRKSHPPKATKIWSQKINIKERRKAIRSALSAAMNKDIVLSHGHLFNEFPLIIEDKFESINKSKEVINILNNLGLEKELERCSIKKVRAGKGKNRERKYRKRKGPLIVVSKESPLVKAALNIPGIDVSIVNNLNAELLAPGTMPGRLTIFTESAIEKLKKENLFNK